MQPLHDPSYKPWLQRERLELDVIMNIAEGAPIGAWPPKGDWLPCFRMLKVDAIFSGELPAIRAKPPKASSVALVDVRAFLDTQQGKPQWDWLRELCKVWSKEAGVEEAGAKDRNDKRSEYTPPSEHGPSAVRPNRRGRKKGTGSYDSEDMPLIEEMHRLIKSGDATGLSDAALAVVNRAPGKGGLDGKLKRLYKKYAAKYGSG